MEVALFAVPGAFALFAAWSGFVRVAGRSFGWLIIALAIFGVAALACWSIGEARTGGLVGIVGAMMRLLMIVGAAGMVAGALLRWAYEWLRRPAAGIAAPGWPWDIALLAVTAAIAVMLSALE